jgi:hypothetical protein
VRRAVRRAKLDRPAPPPCAGPPPVCPFSFRTLLGRALPLAALAAVLPARAQDSTAVAGPPAGAPPPYVDTLYVDRVAPDSVGFYGSGVSGAFLLTEFGLGAGGALRAGVGRGTSLLVEASLGAGRDEREQQFFVGLFGETVTPLKRNYALLLPVTVGVEQRVFRHAIEDSFRPFVEVTGGPALGYQWPYFDDVDGDGVRDDDEERLGPWGGLGRGQFRFGVGGTFAVGAYFGRGRTARGLRFGYAASYFPTPIDLLEEDPDVERPSRRFFGTPVVSFHLLRLTGR